MNRKIMFLSLVVIGLTTGGFSKEKIVKVHRYSESVRSGRGGSTTRINHMMGHQRGVSWYSYNESKFDEIPIFYVYTVDEINDKFSKLRGNVRSDYKEQVSGFKSVRAKVEKLRSNVKSDYEESKREFKRVDQNIENVHQKINGIDDKFENSIQALPSIMTQEILPQVKLKLEDDPEFKQAISTHVMDLLFEEIEKLNARIKKLENGAST